MPQEVFRDPALEWLDHVQPVGLVVSSAVLKDLILEPIPQRQTDSAEVEALIDPDVSKPALADPWAFVETVLGWEARMVAGAAGGPAVPDNLRLRLPEQDTTLAPDWAVADPAGGPHPWQLLVRLEKRGVDPDRRGALDGWEATPHQRFERLLRESDVHVGLLITDQEIRLAYAPKGETSGWLAFPIRPLASVTGRVMLGGLKLMLDRARLFTDAPDRRLPAILKKSRDAQAVVSTALAGQVLGALHELLRGLVAADSVTICRLAKERSGDLYDGLLTVMMRLVFALYAEDRDLLPSRTDDAARTLYENGYSVRGLYARLAEDEALNPDTMDERRGGWGRLLALFRLIHRGHRSGLVQARGGKLFDPDAFPFLEGRERVEDAPRVLPVSDGCILHILEGLMTLAVRGGARERLSYRTLDVEQIGSVYETVMGFSVETASGRALAIHAGKNNHTPVFVDLEQLAALKGKDRLKFLKEEADRGQLSASVAEAVEAAEDAAALAAALDAIVDERGSPKKHSIAAGTPILQPTDERRQTGSHYTPRSLTQPIVQHALEPAFERLGKDARPEDVLALKVCDPAMGSGAFLVEACRALGDRLIEAWRRWPETRPKIPDDEDEPLHVRRLVAQRCLYGVDKNPRAVELAKLSLWLATLARDHEFTFLDHALKSGDSLVGLDARQIAAMNWDLSKPDLPLFRKFVADRVAEATNARAEIQLAADNTARAILEAKHRAIEGVVADVRTLGNAVISAFFAEDKPKARAKRRATIESWVTASPVKWGELRAAAASLWIADRPLTPFHWSIEFPEVFIISNPGFDAVFGNPPFLGGKLISTSLGDAYQDALKNFNPGSKGAADLCAYFFRKAFLLIRQGGAFGLLATNTIAQADTREVGLDWIAANNGCCYRATSSLQWPGEANVNVSVVHVSKGDREERYLNGRCIRKFINTQLLEGDTALAPTPRRLAANFPNASGGTGVLGIGFVIDPTLYRQWIDEDDRYNEIIQPYANGNDVVTSVNANPTSFVINFGDRTEEEAAAYPKALARVRELVKPIRDKLTRQIHEVCYWKHWDKRADLYREIATLSRVLVCPFVSKHVQFAFLPISWVYSKEMVVIPTDRTIDFAVLQSSAHAIWARRYSSTHELRLRYSISDALRTFPLVSSDNDKLRIVGDDYLRIRDEIRAKRQIGLTTVYNRLHDRNESSDDIMRFRDLRAEMDRGVLLAYGWSDLAERAKPIFLDETNEDDQAYQGRLFWPSAFRDEVLARLLAINAERAAAERAAGLTAATSGDEENEEQ